MLCSSVALSRFDGVKVFACILVTCCDFALFIGGRKRWWDGTGGGLTVEEELQSDVGNRLKVIFVLAKCIGIIILEGENIFETVRSVAINRCTITKLDYL